MIFSLKFYCEIYIHALNNLLLNCPQVLSILTDWKPIFWICVTKYWIVAAIPLRDDVEQSDLLAELRTWRSFISAHAVSTNLSIWPGEMQLDLIALAVWVEKFLSSLVHMTSHNHIKLALRRLFHSKFSIYSFLLLPNQRVDHSSWRNYPYIRVRIYTFLHKVRNTQTEYTNLTNNKHFLTCLVL